VRDLSLFRLLVARAWTDPSLPALLGELAELTARERVPYFASLIELIDAEAPTELRDAALRALAGAEGYLAVLAIVRQLGTAPEPALQALAAASATNPARWAHALFHPHDHVRRAAVALGTPEAARHLELHLVADPATRDVVLSRPLPARKTDVVPVLDFVRAGLLAPAIARELLAAADVTGWLRASRTRDAERCTAYLATALRAEGPDAALLARADDDLDDLFALFAPDPAAFALLLRRAGSALFEDAAVRTATSLVKLMANAPDRTHPRRHLLEAALRAHLPLVRAAWIARADRREAATVLYGAVDDPMLAEHEVLPLLFDPICTHEDGGPDLAVIGAVLSRLTDYYYRSVVRWIGRDNLASALAARPEPSARFFFAPDADVEHPTSLLALLPSTRARRRLLVAFAREAPLPVLAFLEHCDPLDVAHVLSELVPYRIDAERSATMATALVRRIGPVRTAEALGAWRGRARGDGQGDLAHDLLFASAREHATDAWVEAFRHAPCLPFVLDRIDREPTFPYGKEVALAEALASSANGAERAWAERRVRAKGEPAPTLPKSDVTRDIPTAKVEELGRLLAPVARGGARGAAALLAKRTDSTASVAATVALLASPDPPEESAPILVRYASDDPRFVKEVDVDMVARFAHGTTELSLFGHAWLWRWERHAKRVVDELCAKHGSLAGGLAAVRTLPWDRGRADLFAAAARWLAVSAARDEASFHALLSPMLVEALVLALPRAEGPWAAEALSALARTEAGGEIAARRVADVRLLLPDLAEETRARLARFIDAAGLERRAVPPPARPPAPDVVAEIERTTDLDRLEAIAAGDDAGLVHEAVLRLMLLGVGAQVRLAALLERSPSVPHVRPIAESIPLWDEGDALWRVRALADDPGRPRELRYRVARSLVERAERRFFDVIFAVLREETSDRFFEPRDWDALVALAGDAVPVAVALAPSPHPHAYLRAVACLLERPEGEAGKRALLEFLERGTERMGSLRRSAAAFLHARGAFAGFPLVLQQELDTSAGTSVVLRGVPARLVELATTSMLAAGNGLAKEAALLHHLGAPGVDPIAAEDATDTVLRGATTDAIRQKAASRLKAGFGLGRFRKLRRVADTFAWGVRTGRELTGHAFRVQMTGGASLGHTRLNERKIYVTPLPILRGEQHGREIVEGLILHEYGHHLYHKGTAAQAVWDEAQKAGLHGVLNLVADEHLERNLRAMDASYGDRLKRLAAYAFQHTAREIAVETVLAHLGGRAFEVLSKTQLGVARDPASVVVESGELLSLMERSGMAFSRFVRALRMGLGNRHDDPRVERALELFRGAKFRASTMADLWTITKELKEIFGWETQLVSSFGPHESLEPGSADELIWGEGISQEELEREVERVLDPRADRRDPGTSGSPGRPWLNVNPKNDFDRITVVQKLPFDAAEHAKLAARVQRPAALMRRYLEELGLRLVAQRMRLSGFRVDRARLKPLVLRGDPRALVARTREVKSDLFLGIVVDCSGSMSARDNMERARLFAALLAEAARGLPGVDFRAFGFTDRVIYDAGDGARCAAHALEAGGGNNDAAGLFHVANVAKASKRKAKLLVMISDGLPTECTVAALRELVNTLGAKERMVCAQAAVQPLAEVCFPNYVVLADPSIEITVNKFGKVVARLVQRALSM
jgi:hypothetical protein